MTTAKCKKSGRKHTPIVSEKQGGLFGAEYRRRKEGKASGMPSITRSELRGHLKESKGKDLPERSILKKKGVALSKFRGKRR